MLNIMKIQKKYNIPIFLFIFILAFFSSPVVGFSQQNLSKPSSLFNQEIFLDNSVASSHISGEHPRDHEAKNISEGFSEKARSSDELVRLAWEASSKNDLKKLNKLVEECVRLYGNEADLLQEQLGNKLPPRGKEDEYRSLNDVATCLFIQAEAIMNNGRKKEAIEKFSAIIKKYPSAQAWDPRGWYWSVAEKSQESIDVLTGKADKEDEEGLKKVLRTKPHLFVKPKEKIVDYTKYGKFLNVGTERYHYSILNLKGLSEAVGEGIYPNIADIYKNPRYKIVKKEGRLKGNHWDFVNSDDLEAAYFKWFTAPEPWGVRLFYLGTIFEKANMPYAAIRAYHALIVHFPKTVAWTYWQTPWYPAQAAVAKIKYILRIHPEMNLVAKYMKIKVKNGFDNDINNDVIITYPGKIVKKSLIDKGRELLRIKKTVPLNKVKKYVGHGTVRLVQYENGHWQLLVNDKPYIIKGITYAPTKVGESPDKGTLVNWMDEDTNNNGLPDGPYDAWVDVNRNNKKDPDEPVVGDFKLMKDMGVNTLRIYVQPNKPNKALLRKMFKEFGFRVIMGNFLGKYAIDSGATWREGTDYENPEHKKKMMESIKKMVMEYKDEPYILLWLLGNENNYGIACNADKKPEAYYKFVDEVAQWIKSVDPNHPVAINNGDTLYLDIFAKYCPHVDIFAANVYRGDYGFGAFWEQVADACDKPAFITEYGCPAYAKNMTLEEAEEAQAKYLKGNWLDIVDNMAGTANGVGNALGGIVFEWTDEWWKNYEPYRHDKKSDAIGPFPGGYYYEEWFGITSQGDGSHSPFLRQLRKSYFMYKQLWNQ